MPLANRLADGRVAALVDADTRNIADGILRAVSVLVQVKAGLMATEDPAKFG